MKVISTIKKYFRQQKYKGQFDRDREGEGPAILFYAEDKNSWPHLGPIVAKLTERDGKKISYITSSEEDPHLESSTVYFVEYAPSRQGLRGCRSDMVCMMTDPNRSSTKVDRRA